MQGATPPHLVLELLILFLGLAHARAFLALGKEDLPVRLVEIHVPLGFSNAPAGEQGFSSRSSGYVSMAGAAHPCELRNCARWVCCEGRTGGGKRYFAPPPNVRQGGRKEGMLRDGGGLPNSL